MSASRTIPSRSPTITPHIETVCANNTRICPTNSNKRASSPLYPGSMASNSISVSVNLNAAPDTAESNYLPLQNLCFRGAGGSRRVNKCRQVGWTDICLDFCEATLALRILKSCLAGDLKLLPLFDTADWVVTEHLAQRG